jgi:hypothetical protein
MPNDKTENPREKGSGSAVWAFGFELPFGFRHLDLIWHLGFGIWNLSVGDCSEHSGEGK